MRIGLFSSFFLPAMKRNLRQNPKHLLSWYKCNIRFDISKIFEIFFCIILRKNVNFL